MVRLDEARPRSGEARRYQHDRTEQDGPPQSLQFRPAHTNLLCRLGIEGPENTCDKGEDQTEEIEVGPVGGKRT